MKIMSLSQLVLAPHKNKGDQSEVETLARLGGRDVWFYSRSGNRLHGWYLDRRTESGLLFFYSMGNDGNIANRVEVLQLLANLGTSVFIYEYSGFGQSDGKPSVSTCFVDAESALNFAQDFVENESMIILYGESLGAAISARLRIKSEAGGLVLKSAFTSLSRLAREMYWPLRAIPAALIPDLRLKTAQCLRRLAGPVLIIHGTGDRKVHPSHAMDLHAACPGNKDLLWLPDSRHAALSDNGRHLLQEGVRLFARKVSALNDLKLTEADYYFANDLVGFDPAIMTAVAESLMLRQAAYRSANADLMQICTRQPTSACSKEVDERDSYLIGENDETISLSQLTTAMVGKQPA